MPCSSQLWGICLPQPPLGFFPTTAELAAASQDERQGRYVFFILAYGGAVMAVALLLALRYAWLQRGSQGRRVERRKTELEAEQTGLFGREEIAFVAYLMTYIYGLGACVTWALSRDLVGERFGLDFELYLPWVLELLGSHLAGAFVLGRDRAGAVCWPKQLLESMVGERLDMLRDTVAVSIYARQGTKASTACLLVSLAALVASHVRIMRSSIALRALRKSYWPGTVPAAEQDHDLASWRVAEDPAPASPDGATRPLVLSSDAEGSRDEEAGALQGGASSKRAGPCAWFPSLGALSFSLQQTSALRQDMLFFEELPQAVAGLLYTASAGEWPPPVLAGVCLTAARVLAMCGLRPYLVCWQARAGRPWRDVSANDLERAGRCGAWCPAPCSSAAAELLALGHAPPAVRMAAAAVLGKGVQVPGLQAPLAELVERVLERLVVLRQEAEFRCLAESSNAALTKRDLPLGPGKSRHWEMVAAILQHSKEANVNYCGMRAADLRDILDKVHGKLPLAYLNLNDNKELCKDEAGVEQVERLLDLAPNLRELKLKSTGLSEEGRRKLERAWAGQPRLLRPAPEPQELQRKSTGLAEEQTWTGRPQPGLVLG